MLVPPLCWSCGEVARRREPLCARCRLRMRRLAPQPVVLCGVPVWAPVAYSGPARDVVRALKFGGATRVADWMAAQMAANAPVGVLEPGKPARVPVGLLEPGEPARARAPACAARARAPAEAARARAPAEAASAPVLVPVPLHPRRLRARGYNQAAVVAAALARRAGLEVADLLERSGSAATQVGRRRAERRAGPAGSIALRHPAAVSLPARVLLVDDVATTGATLAACAAALAGQGCGDVAAITFARTIGR